MTIHGISLGLRTKQLSSLLIQGWVLVCACQSHEISGCLDSLLDMLHTCWASPPVLCTDQNNLRIYSRRSVSLDSPLVAGLASQPLTVDGGIDLAEQSIEYCLSQVGVRQRTSSDAPWQSWVYCSIVIIIVIQDSVIISIHIHILHEMPDKDCNMIKAAKYQQMWIIILTYDIIVWAKYASAFCYAQGRI